MAAASVLPSRNLPVSLEGISDLVVTASELRAHADASERMLCARVVEAFRQLDASDPSHLEAIRDLASFLYWHPLRISLQPIADGLGVSLKHLTVRGFIAPIDMALDCGTCGDPFVFVATCRTNRDKPPKVCGSCSEKEKLQLRTHLLGQLTLDRVSDARRAELRLMPYREYLQTNEWREKRRRQLRSAGYRCQLCNAGNCNLEVHHRTYERRGDETYSDLIVLCGRCHDTFHDRLALDPSSYRKEVAR